MSYLSNWFLSLNNKKIAAFLRQLLNETQQILLFIFPRNCICSLLAD